MFESTGTGVAQLHEDAAALAAGVDVNVSGAEADEALAEVLAAGRQLDLLTCRLIERVDRSGQFGVDAAGSTTAFIRSRINERAEWAAKRVAVARALVDRLPHTAKTAEAGRLGLEHAHVIDHATRRIDDPAPILVRMPSPPALAPPRPHLPTKPRHALFAAPSPRPRRRLDPHRRQ